MFLVNERYLVLGLVFTHEAVQGPLLLDETLTVNNKKLKEKYAND